MIETLEDTKQLIYDLPEWIENWNLLCVEGKELYLLLIAVSTFIAIILFVAYLIIKIQLARRAASVKPRFRKRDKVLFYGRKVFRKVRTSLQGAGKNRISGRKRQMVLKFAKTLLRLRKEQPLQLEVKEPSQAFLEEDLTREDFDQRLPHEVICMLRGIRVFGFFDRPVFLQLCRQLEIIEVPKGQMLFSIGHKDDSIYIVQSGKVQVFITEPDGTELILKLATASDTIASLLSVLDVLCGNVAPFKTVSARAVEDSILVKLEVEAFGKLLEGYPDTFIRVIQIIMVRLQRVMLAALHKYLGLTTQLICHKVINGHKRTSSVTQPNGTNLTNSPTNPLRPTRVSLGNFPHSYSCSYQEAEDIKATLKSLITKEGDKSQDISTAKGENEEKMTGQLLKQKSLNLFTERTKRERCVPNEEVTQSMTKKQLEEMAIAGFMEELLIDNKDLFNGKIIIQDLGPRIYLTQEESNDEIPLYYVLSGSLSVSLKNVDSNERSVLFIVLPGEMIGALEVITGETAAFTITTRHSCKLALIKKQHVYEILSYKPKAVLQLTQSVTKRLSPFVRQVDFALDWVFYESGRAIFRQDDEADNTFIVLSGRLRSVITRTNKKELIGEFGRGDLVGIVEVLAQTRRSTTVIAVRDSELAKLPNGLLDVIKIKYPAVVTRLVHLLGHRILGSLEQVYQSVSPESIGLRPTGSNFSTVAVLAVTDDVPLHAFSIEIHHALSSIGSTLHLTSTALRENLGSSALDSSNEYRLSSWLGQQEDQHRIVLYQCDNHFSAWSQRCIRQADCILIVALADQKPTVGKIEQQLDSLAFRTQKELILLHKDHSSPPSNTVLWLNIRSWCSSHHHIRCPKRMFVKLGSPLKVKEYFNSVFNEPPDIHSDFSRLARFLTGTSIGLVLGGGGARGSAHVGMLRAIKEAGIPIDMVGGVSIGAFMGALWCQELDLDEFTKKARKWSNGMTSYWRQILDLTYPTTAMFSGAFFNHCVRDIFGEKQIEDLWLPYFTVTTDISSSSQRTHRYGSLWRYVRSSMSLSGYLPPLCDPTDGHLLLDGGYVNNLPADVMKDVMGAETIFAVDVGSADDTDFYNYGDVLSGWWLLWKKWNPFCNPVKVPSLPEIQSKLAYVGCVRQLEQVKSSEYCTYIRPPIDKWKTMQFGSFDDIMETGYNYGKALFSSVKPKNIKNKEADVSVRYIDQVHRYQSLSSSNHPSFIDLAERVCKIRSPERKLNFKELSEYSDDEEPLDEFDNY